VTSSASESLGGDPDCRSVSGQLGPHLQLVVNVHVECGAKGVQIGVHETSKVEVALSNADLGHLFRAGGGPLRSSDPLEPVV